MSNIYRVCYKKGDVELNVESSDKDYIDGKLAEFWNPSVGECITAMNFGQPNRNNLNEVADSSKSSTSVSEAVLASIIGSINDAENYDDIERHVLDRPDRIGRILMCYYFAYKHPVDPPLTTTHVERITSQLGIKIASANVAKVIRGGAGKYLTADRVRQKGIGVHYKINRRGTSFFEQITSGQTR
jgi:hypothetical protein